MTNVNAAPHRATIIKVSLDESFRDHFCIFLCLTGNQVLGTFDSPEAGGCFFVSVVNAGIPR